MTVTRCLLAVFLLIFWTGCSGQSEVPSDDRSDEKIGRLSESTGINTEADSEDAVISIGPVGATVRSIINLKANSPISNGEIYWTINGIKGEPSNKRSFLPLNLTKGDTVRALIDLDGKELRSNEIVIGNSPPVIEKAGIIPEMPVRSSIITVNIRTGDADNDKISYRYNWTLNGKFAGEDSYLETDLKRDDKITVKVTPYDGESEGRHVTLTGKVYNSLPRFTDSEPSFDGENYEYKIDVVDPDGDNLIFKIEEGPEGMTIDTATGHIKWEVGENAAGSHEVKVSVSDGHGGKILIPFTTRIGFKESGQ